MRTTDEQVLRLRAERARGRNFEVAAMRAGMHRNTARKYVSGPLPSERVRERTWRTREDPFAEDWPAMVAMLKESPDLEAKALFEYLQRLRPGRYQAAPADFTRATELGITIQGTACPRTRRTTSPSMRSTRRR